MVHHLEGVGLDLALDITDTIHTHPHPHSILYIQDRIACNLLQNNTQEDRKLFSRSYALNKKERGRKSYKIIRFRKMKFILNKMFTKGLK